MNTTLYSDISATIRCFFSLRWPHVAKTIGSYRQRGVCSPVRQEALHYCVFPRYGAQRKGANFAVLNRHRNARCAA